MEKPLWIICECLCGKDADSEDPINIMRGAFHTENRLMSMAGVRDIYFDINYDSTKTDNEGDLGYGWYHNYESYIQDENGFIQVYFNPQTSMSFVNKNAKEMVVQGVYENGVITVLPSEEGAIAYVPASDGYQDYTLMKKQDGYYLTLPDGSTYEYDAEGVFTKTTNLYGQSISISYEGQTMALVDDATGKSFVITKNDKGYIEKVTDVAGNQISFTYTENGDLATVTNKRGFTTTYSYDDNHKIVQGVDADNQVFLVNTYDEQGRVLTQDDGREDTPLVTLSYVDDEETGLTTVTLKNRNGGTQTIVANAAGDGIRLDNSIGGVTSYEYDEEGNVIKYATPSGCVENYSRDERGNIVEYSNNYGEKYSFTYNENNQVTSEISNTGLASYYEYNENNQLSKATENGKVTTYTYNEQGQVLTETVEGVGTTAYTYENGNVTSITSPTGAVERFTYDVIGNVVEYVNGNGICRKVEIDANGHITKESVVMENGETAETSCTYDAYGSPTSVTDANGNTTLYEYNSDGYCTKEIRADGSEIGYTYDVDGNITKIVYPDNIATESAVYDTAGNLLSVKDALGSVTTENFNSGSWVTKVIQANGGEISYEYYDNGLLKTQTDAEGNVYQFTYDEAGRITQLVDGAGNSSQFLYDAYGNLTTIIDGEGNKTSMSYDHLGQIQSTTDANGNITKYSYDANGNIASQIDALGHETVYVYDNGNQVVQVIQKGATEAENHVFKYAYDALGNITQMTDAEGNTYQMEYDKVGNLTKLYDAKNQLVLSYTYDQVYNVVKETDALGNSTIRSYDSMGNCIKEVNAKGYAVSYKYLGGQLMTASVDALGSTSTATYDSMGNLESFTNPNGGVTSYTYDLNGNMTSEAVGDYYKVSYTYNEIGQVATKENAKGQLTDYQYNKAGRLVSFTDEIGTVCYTYDGNGNVLTVTEEKKDGTKAVITRTYDALNRVKTYTDGAGNTLTYEYDCFGNLASLTYPEGQKVTYEYDKNGNLTQMTDWQERSTSYSYNENSMLVKTERPDGTIETRDYDIAGRLSYIVDKKDETIINSYFYGYDAVGNIVSITSEPITDGGQAQTANIKNTQQTDNDVRSTDNVTQSASRSTVNLSNVQDTEMEYDKTNRLIKYNGQAVKYDDDGNMTYGPLNGEMTTFIYDCRNRLIQAGDTTYQYDAENYRIGMTKNVGTQSEIKVTYVVDSGSGELSQVLKSVETDKVGNSKVLYYFYGANKLVAQEEYKDIQLVGDNSNDVKASEVEGIYLLYHFNNVGSTTAITDENGNVKYQYQYSPYGELIAGTYGQVAFLYNGQYGVTSDANGLYYMRARYYNIDIKRFSNQDVVIGSIERSSSLNRYAYVEGNPISYIDPFGMERETVIDEEGNIWYKLESGYLYQKTGDTKLKLKNDIDFTSKTVCLKVGKEIVEAGLIKGMTALEVAVEIYFHVCAWQAMKWGEYCEGKAFFDIFFEIYDSAKDTDLDDGGEPILSIRLCFWSWWQASYAAGVYT